MNNVIKISEYTFDEKFLRAKDLQKIFIGIKQATFDTWVRIGLLNRYKIGGSVFYKLSEVKSMIERVRE
jgi:hypothetical protein